MFDRFSVVLAFCLTLCFCLIIFVAIQEKRAFTGMKNINKNSTENILNNNVTESLNETLDKLTEIINSLGHESDVDINNFEIFKKRYDEINIQDIEPKHIIFLFRQLLNSTDCLLKAKKDLSRTVDCLKNTVSNMNKMINVLKETNKCCNITNESPLTSSLSSQTYPVNPKEHAVEQTSTTKITLQINNDDNNGGSNLVMELNTSDTDEIEVTKSVSEILGHSDYIEGTYLGEVESDKNGSINIDLKTNSVADSSEGRHLVTELYYLDKAITEDLSNIKKSDSMLDKDNSLKNHYNHSTTDDKDNHDKKAIAVNVEEATEDSYHLPSTNIYSDDEEEKRTSEDISQPLEDYIVHSGYGYYDTDMIDDTDWLSTQKINDNAAIDPDPRKLQYIQKFDLPRGDKVIHEELYRENEETPTDQPTQEVIDDTLTDPVKVQHFVKLELPKEDERELYEEKEETATDSSYDHLDPPTCNLPIEDILYRELYRENEEDILYRELYRENEETPPDSSNYDYLDTTVSDNNQTQDEFSLFINETVSVLESIHICEKMGMRLATILSKEEQKTVHALIKKTSQEFPDVLNNDFWISGLITDDENNPEYWLNPLSSEADYIRYTNWTQGHQRIYSYFTDIPIRFVCVFLGHQHELSWSSADCMESGRYAVCRRSSSNMFFNLNFFYEQNKVI